MRVRYSQESVCGGTASQVGTTEEIASSNSRSDAILLWQIYQFPFQPAFAILGR